MREINWSRFTGYVKDSLALCEISWANFLEESIRHEVACEDDSHRDSAMVFLAEGSLQPSESERDLIVEWLELLLIRDDAIPRRDKPLSSAREAWEAWLGGSGDAFIEGFANYHINLAARVERGDPLTLTDLRYLRDQGLMYAEEGIEPYPDVSEAMNERDGERFVILSNMLTEIPALQEGAGVLYHQSFVDEFLC